MSSRAPTTFGYGITSDPIRDCSYDSLSIAVQTIIRQPWLVTDVDPSACEVEECSGYIARKTTLNATGERVVERVTINEEIGEVTFSKCGANGEPGRVDRVLAIHRSPLRLEFFKRNAGDLMRQNWTSPADTARQIFETIAQIAKKLEKKSSEIIGFGVASKPVSGMTQDDLWKAMLFSVRNPDKCGMKVADVKVKDVPGYMQKPGHMQRSVRLLEQPGCPSVTDNVRVLENALEITYRPVEGGKESEMERVFALRTNPLRCEMFCRHSKTEMRIDWQAPRAVAKDVFQAVTLVGV